MAGPGIVVGRKGNPGIVTWTHGEFFPIDTTFYVVPKDTNSGLPFLFFALTSQDLPSVAADSAVPGLNRNLAYMNRQLLPDNRVAAEFNIYARDIFLCRHHLDEESRILTTQRDALLPGLILGKVKLAGMCQAGASKVIRQSFDKKLEERIYKLETTVETWARRNDLWHDACFRRVVRSFDADTGAPTVTTLRAVGLLAELVIHPGIGAIHDTRGAQRLSDECQQIIEGHGFYGETFDVDRLDIIPLEQKDSLVFQRFKEYMRWKWICSLVQPVR